MNRSFASKAATANTKSDTPTINTGQNGEWFERRPGKRFRICTSAAQTNGAYSVVEIVAEHGYGTPVHIHENEAEHFVVVEGTASMLNGDQALEATAGEIFIAKGESASPRNTRIRTISAEGALERGRNRMAANPRVEQPQCQNPNSAALTARTIFKKTHI